MHLHAKRCDKAAPFTQGEVTLLPASAVIVPQCCPLGSSLRNATLTLLERVQTSGALHIVCMWAQELRDHTHIPSHAPSVFSESLEAGRAHATLRHSGLLPLSLRWDLRRTALPVPFTASVIHCCIKIGHRFSPHFQNRLVKLGLGPRCK